MAEGVVGAYLSARPGRHRRSLAAAGTLALVQLADAIPMGRLCSASDVVEAIRFLADSSRAGFITGQVLYVDGSYLHAG